MNASGITEDNVELFRISVGKVKCEVLGVIDPFDWLLIWWWGYPVDLCQAFGKRVH